MLRGDKEKAFDEIYLKRLCNAYHSVSFQRALMHEDADDEEFEGEGGLRGSGVKSKLISPPNFA